MKAVALKIFRDKFTGEVYSPGEVLTLERERFSEIQEKLGNSYIAEIVDPEITPEPEKSESGISETDNPEVDAPESGISETDNPESASAAKTAKRRSRRKAEG